MAKELEKIKGSTVIHQYQENGNADKIAALFIKSLTGDKPIKHEYYECVDSKGNVVFIFTDRTIAMSVAARFGYDYRTVEYEERFEKICEPK